MQEVKGSNDLALLIGRVFYSSLFLLYGYLKLTGYTDTVEDINAAGLPAAGIFATVAIIIEFGGGLLMLLGYQTRLVALGLAFSVLVAGLIRFTHSQDALQLTLFMKNMAIVGGSLAFFVSGAGAYSLDGRKQ